MNVDSLVVGYNCHCGNFSFVGTGYNFFTVTAEDLPKVCELYHEVGRENGRRIMGDARGGRGLAPLYSPQVISAREIFI